MARNSIADCTLLLAGDYTTPALSHCYVSHQKTRETVKTSQWLLLDDAVRDRLRQSKQLFVESLKSFK